MKLNASILTKCKYLGTAAIEVQFLGECNTILKKKLLRSIYRMLPCSFSSEFKARQFQRRIHHYISDVPRSVDSKQTVH